MLSCSGAEGWQLEIFLDVSTVPASIFLFASSLLALESTSFSWRQC